MDKDDFLKNIAPLQDKMLKDWLDHKPGDGPNGEWTPKQMLAIHDAMERRNRKNGINNN
ncbi:hypothetical protein OYT88_04645 [Sporolactobacillus sp. CQH2019]|uniref:hypothetical protein n=1 Tax=Sporolactobacillus sp. CQH2019 TaxID=3023512 RepID=UPI00236785CD|nr:hypothetical protein [Sporolactobacillus sp. CQH2019]MDD9147837.1 hypothetical protein [Sporolactobacillus sp. CQH2019]